MQPHSRAQDSHVPNEYARHSAALGSSSPKILSLEKTCYLLLHKGDVKTMTERVGGLPGERWQIHSCENWHRFKCSCESELEQWFNLPELQFTHTWNGDYNTYFMKLSEWCNGIVNVKYWLQDRNGRYRVKCDIKSSGQIASSFWLSIWQT